MNDPTTRQTPIALLTAYGLMLVLYLVGGLLPGERIWGIDWWAFFPSWIPWLLFAAGIALGLWFYLKPENQFEPEAPESSDNSRYLLISVGIVVVSGLLFYFFRTRTHFLGDGYNLLTQLEKGIHVTKFTGWGESVIHIQLKNWLGGDSASAAIASFRIISIASGVAFVISCLGFARMLFDGLRDRLLFVAGLLSCGYMLLYFGYVEYYSGFITGLTIFCLTGLAVARGKVSRWWLIPTFLLALFFHVFALTLLPGAVYLLLSGTAAGNAWKQLKLPYKILIGVALHIVGLLVFYRLYDDHLFFRLSLLTVFENRFTQEGYTIFSRDHIVDYLNLLLLMVPALPFAVVAFFTVSRGAFSKGRDKTFLVINAIATVAVAFVLNPSYGMPRDWDLFTFIAVPLALLCFYLLLRNRVPGTGQTRAVMLASMLGFLMLGPRVASQIVGDVSVAHFDTYIHRNLRVEKDGHLFLKEYFNRTGDSVKELEHKLAWQRLAIDDRLVIQGDDYFNAGNPERAGDLFREALAINPIHAVAWSNLGKCFLRMDQLDSAIYCQKVASAMRPYNAVIKNNLGLAYYYNRDYDKAEKAWLEAIARDSSLTWPRVFLTRQYRDLGHEEKYDSLLIITAERPDAPAEIVRQLGEYHLRMEDSARALESFRRAMSIGLDSTEVSRLFERYPRLLETD